MCAPLTIRNPEIPGFWLWNGAEFKFYPSNPWSGPSHTFTCPKCGIVWAKAFSGHSEKGWQPYSMICENCPGWVTKPAGTLYIEWALEFTAVFPRELLIREFWIEVNAAKNF